MNMKRAQLWFNVIGIIVIVSMIFFTLVPLLAK
jgi:hypothetical protein